MIWSSKTDIYRYYISGQIIVFIRLISILINLRSFWIDESLHADWHLISASSCIWGINVHLWPWLLVITGYFYGMKYILYHSINGVSSVLITGIWGLNCKQWFVLHLDLLMGTNRWTKQAVGEAAKRCIWIPSGKHTKSYGKIHHFQWENPLFLWPCSIATLNYQRVTFAWLCCVSDLIWCYDSGGQTRVVVIQGGLMRKKNRTLCSQSAGVVPAYCRRSEGRYLDCSTTWNHPGVWKHDAAKNSKQIIVIH